MLKAFIGYRSFDSTHFLLLSPVLKYAIEEMDRNGIFPVGVLQ